MRFGSLDKDQALRQKPNLPMNFFPFSRKKKAVRKPARKSSTKRNTELAQELEKVRKHKEEADRRAAEIQARIDDVPKQIKRREDLELQRIKERAKRTRTMQGFDRMPQRVRSSVAGVKLTRAQQRAVMNKFLLLCALLAGMLYFLWKAAR